MEGRREIKEINEINSIEDIYEELAELYSLEDEVALKVQQAATSSIDLYGTELSYTNIKLRIEYLADEIAAEYAGKPSPVLISLLDGALPFAGQLQDALLRRNFKFDYTTIRTRSYDGDKAGELEIISPPKGQLGGRYVIVLDDVWDTGNTFAGVKRLLKEGLGARSVDLAAMVNKVQERAVEPDRLFSGFDVDKSAFIIGFGLDYDGKCRDMLDIKAVDYNILKADEEFQYLNALIKRIKPLNDRLQELLAAKKPKAETEIDSNSSSSNSPLLALSILSRSSGEIDSRGRQDLEDFINSSNSPV